MTDRRAITVIIPAYNTAGYIDRTLRNIAEEQFGNSPADFWEIIVVNDGSKDDTERMAQMWAERYPDNINVITQENQGVSAARNRGIDEARGEYLYFMDSDDLLRQGALPDLVEAADDTRADMLAFNYLIITPDEYQSMADKAPQKIVLPKPVAMSAFDYIRITHGSEPPFGFWVVWRAIYRKSFLKSSGEKFDTDMICGEDSLYMLRLLLHNPRMGVVSSTLYFYNNLRPDNATTAINREHLERFTLNRVKYVNRINELKPIIESTENSPKGLYEAINFSTRCYFKMISVDAIMLDASLRDLMRLRRWYKSMGGKVKPGSPRFFNKARKYTSRQKSKRWLFAFPLMTLGGIVDWISGKGLWRDSKKLWENREHLNHTDDIIPNTETQPGSTAIITGHLTDENLPEIKDTVTKLRNSGQENIMVWSYAMSPEQEETLSKEGLSVFSYGRFNDIVNPSPQRQAEVLSAFRKLEGIDKTVVIDGTEFASEELR